METNVFRGDARAVKATRTAPKNLLLAVETGVCLVSLSAAAWGQAIAPDAEQSPSSEEPPDQAVPETDDNRWVTPTIVLPQPEYQPAAEFLSPRSGTHSTQSSRAIVSEQAVREALPRPLATASPPAIAQSLSPEPEPPKLSTASPAITTAPTVAPERPTATPTMSPPSPRLPLALPRAEPSPIHRANSATDVSGVPTSNAPAAVGISTRASDLLGPQAETSLRPQFAGTAATIAPASPSGAPTTAPRVVPLGDTAATPTSADQAVPSTATAIASPSPDSPPPEEAASPPTTEDPAAVPTAIKPGVLSPLVTSIPVDGEFVPFEQEGNVAVGASFGEDRSANLRFDGTFTLDRALTSRNTAGNVTVLSQYQTLLRGQEVLRERQLSISRRDPVTVLGQNMQVTLLADCLDGTGAVCTYTPGLVTDRDRIDPETLLPTQIDQTSLFRDTVTPASLAAIQAPGFQLGADGQAVGLDLYFPNTTTLPGNRLSTNGEALRHEELESMPAIAYSEIFQTVAGNADTASLARTIRGPAIVFDTEQPITNLVLAAVSLLLPEVQPFVPASAASSNPNISQGLFFAANNTRIPSNSLTLYQAGIGHSATPPATGTPGDLPPATFNAVWLGLSPVTERSYATESVFENVSDPRVILSAGGEGGGLNAPEVLAFTTGETFSNSALNNVYTQNYFTLFEQDADRLETFVQNDRIRYHPHLSLTGNITGPSDILRYYVGTIAGETIQAYGGVNYQGQTPDGWAYRAGAIGYINPNYDRYSNLSAGVSRRLNLGDRETLTLGTSFNWALDQDTSLEDIEQTGQGSDITVQARLDLGDVAIGAAQVIGDVLPNSQSSRTVLDAAVKLGEDVTLAGFWAPFDNATSAPQYGLLADVGFRVGGIEPHLVFSWQNTLYEYGEDLLGNDLSTRSDTFEILLKLDW